jgi:hypothetical protein
MVVWSRLTVFWRQFPLRVQPCCRPWPCAHVAETCQDDSQGRDTAWPMGASCHSALAALFVGQALRRRRSVNHQTGVIIYWCGMQRFCVPPGSCGELGMSANERQVCSEKHPPLCLRSDVESGTGDVGWYCVVCNITDRRLGQKSRWQKQKMNNVSGKRAAQASELRTKCTYLPQHINNSLLQHRTTVHSTLN